MARKNKLDLKKVVMRNERSGSYSVFFVEPGGNYWEIESYQHRHEAGLADDVSYPWTKPLTDDQFPGRGYIPQAFTHGTIECTERSSRRAGRTPLRIRHPRNESDPGQRSRPIIHALRSQSQLVGDRMCSQLTRAQMAIETCNTEVRFLNPIIPILHHPSYPRRSDS